MTTENMGRCVSPCRERGLETICFRNKVSVVLLLLVLLRSTVYAQNWPLILVLLIDGFVVTRQLQLTACSQSVILFKNQVD